jgi:uncharacterized protein
VPATLTIPLTPPQTVPAISAECWDGGASSALVLAHGAGTDRTNPLLRSIAEGVARRGPRVLTFNFAYAEAGRRRPDPPARLESAWRDVIAFAGHRFGPSVPLVLGGRSMGGRVASQVAAQGTRCGGLVFLAYPLHPPGRPERLRVAHWPALSCPVLFVHGDRDPFGAIDEVERERARHLTGAASQVHRLAGADHGFKMRRGDGRTSDDVVAEVVTTVADWLEGLAS